MDPGWRLPIGEGGDDGPREWDRDHVSELGPDSPWWCLKFAGKKRRPQWLKELRVCADDVWRTARPYPLPAGVTIPEPSRGLRLAVERAPWLVPEPKRKAAERGEYWRSGQNEEELAGAGTRKRRRDSPDRMAPIDPSLGAYAVFTTARARRTRRKALHAYMRFRHFANEARSRKKNPWQHKVH